MDATGIPLRLIGPPFSRNQDVGATVCAAKALRVSAAALHEFIHEVVEPLS
jgi:hypothetical protein